MYQRASLPSRETARSRSSAAVRLSLVATTSSWSPRCSRVSAFGHQALAVADHERQHRTARQPQLVDVDAVQVRTRPDEHLEQVGAGALERRRLDLEVARLEVLDDAEPAADRSAAWVPGPG